MILSTSEMQSLAEALNEDLDDGILKLYSGSSPGPNEAVTGTLLSSSTLPDKAANSVADGVLTFGTIADVNGVGTGLAGYARFLQSDDSTVICDATVGISGSGADIILDNLNISIGQKVSLSGTVTIVSGA